MFKASIILVDDKQSELDQLSKAFALSGLPCLPILFDGDSPENETGIDHLKADTRNARIIALDINLKESPNTQNAVHLYPTIEMVLDKLKPEGPYFLIFWSKYKDLPQEIINLLAQRSADVITAPIEWGFIDKTIFGEDSNTLPGKVLENILRIPIFKLLLEWEERTNNAASKTLSELYRIATSSNNNGWQFEETNNKLINLLTHIAHESVGHKNAKESANQAIESGLMPILEDNLLAMANAEDNDCLNDEWKNCLPKLGNRNAVEALSTVETAELNSFYNLENVRENFPKNQRGVFVTLADDLKNKQEDFQLHFGNSNTLKKLIHEEFLFNTNHGNSNDRKNARNKVALGWLEVGAACDQAQVKNRLHRYILSCMVPSDFFELVCTKNDDGVILKDKAHEGIYRSPVIKYKDNNFIILVSFRYTVGLHENSKLLGESMFRLKDQIVNEIAFAWSKYIVRPGITSFR